MRRLALPIAICLASYVYGCAAADDCGDLALAAVCAAASDGETIRAAIRRVRAFIGCLLHTTPRDPTPAGVDARRVRKSSQVVGSKYAPFV